MIQTTSATFVSQGSDDELDFLSGATSPTLVGSETPSLSLADIAKNEGRMTLRQRQAKEVTVPKPKNGKRKRTQSESKIQQSITDAFSKRTKLDDKVAHTAGLNKKRVRIETARKRWLLKHRDLFAPLLPENNVYFSGLEKELKISADSSTYLPLHELDEQPALVKGGEMKDYQLHGLSFLVWMYNNGMNSILGDEMGLGKTLQTLSLFAYIAEHETPGSIDPHLIICPLSVLSAWQSEAARWLPSFKALRFHGANTERDRLKHATRNGGLKFDICITTYEAYVAEDTWFKSKQWTYIVLDEGHKIKNSGTNVAHKLQGLGSLYKLILTGTPIQNNLVELWGLLHWLYPKVFTQTTERLFQDSWDLSRGSYSTSFLVAANKLLSTVMLRRTKSVVECTVPSKEELTVFIPMSEAQRFWTLGLLTRLDVTELEKIFQSKMEGTESKEYITQMKQSAKQGLYRRLQNLLMQLRMVCDHPYLLPGAEPTPFVLGEHIVASSSKLSVIDKLLADIIPKGERVLIFSQWTGMLDLLEDFMNLRGIQYARLDGNTYRPRRSLDIRLFQREDSPYKVFLISTRAGGLGINLTKASHVVMFDSDWNPQNDLQAIARAHRIGQTKTVKVYRLICQGSVEDQMLDRLRRKLFLSLKIMGTDSSALEPSADPNNNEASNSSVSELMDILRRGSSSLSSSNSNSGSDAGGMNLTVFLGAGIEEILSASRERDELRMMKLQNDLGDENSAPDSNVDSGSMQERWEEEERALLAGVAQVQSRLFEGQLVQRAVQTKPHSHPSSSSHHDAVSLQGVQGSPSKNLRNGSNTPSKLQFNMTIGGSGKASSSGGNLGSLSVSKGNRENRAMADAWQEVQRRAATTTPGKSGRKKSGVIMVNGLGVDIGLVGPGIVSADSGSNNSTKPRKRRKFENEDWCIHCRDGGEVVCCTHCPRVFHSKCRGMSKASVLRVPQISCMQHLCISCGRNTTDSGGMLFRCQTCPQAFCEDCIDFDSILPIGSTIPEFVLCHYPAQSSAYFIRCGDCLEVFRTEPEVWEAWKAEIGEYERRVGEMEMEEAM